MVWQPLLSVWLEAEAEVKALGAQPQDPNPRRSCETPDADPQACIQLGGGLLQVSSSTAAGDKTVPRLCPLRGVGRAKQYVHRSEGGP